MRLVAETSRQAGNNTGGLFTYGSVSIFVQVRDRWGARKAFKRNALNGLGDGVSELRWCGRSGRNRLRMSSVLKQALRHESRTFLEVIKTTVVRRIFDLLAFEPRSPEPDYLNSLRRTNVGEFFEITISLVFLELGVNRRLHSDRRSRRSRVNDRAQKCLSTIIAPYGRFA